MRNFLLIICFAFCTGAYAQKGKSDLLFWHDNTSENYLSTPVKYTERGKFYYNLSNDKDKLYVLLKIFDKDVQRQVLYSGITVWINMDNKKSKITGFRYPARVQEQGPREPGGMNNRQNQQLLIAPKIEIIGRSESGPEYVSTDGSADFKGTMKFEKDGNMWYELIIPLSKMPVKSAGAKNEDGSFMIGISYPGIISQGMPGGGMSEGAMGGRGGGGRGMGGRGGGRGSGGAAGRPGGTDMSSSSASPVIIWYKDMRFASQ